MVGSDREQVSNPNPNDGMEEKSFSRQVNSIAKQVKEKRTRWNVSIMLLMLLAMACQPGLASLLSVIGIGMNGDVSKENVGKMVKAVNDHS